MSVLTRRAVLEALSDLDEVSVAFSRDEADIALIDQVPPVWWDSLTLGPVDRAALEEIWNPVAANLDGFLEELVIRLQGLAVARIGDTAPFLLYAFLTESGKPIFYKGFPPIRVADIPSDMADAWGDAPAGLADLYAVHDGWTLLRAWSRGHLPVAEWLTSSSEQWVIEHDVAASFPYDIDRIVFVSQDGGGGYTGFLRPETPGQEAKVILWRVDEPTSPKLSDDFLPIYGYSNSVALQEFVEAEA